MRHNLADARLTAEDWRNRWDAARLFLTADGESGAPHGNYTISVDPADGSVTIVLPEPLRYLANQPRGRYRLSCTATFHHLREEWLDRITASRAVRYDIVYDPARDRWYLDASWSAAKAVLPSPEEIRAAGGRLLAVDLNADHLAAYVLDPHGNPVAEPLTVPLEPTGDAPRRDGRLRAAVTSLIQIAQTRLCWDRDREPGLHRRPPDRPGDDGARPTRQGIPPHGGRHPDREVQGTAARYGLPPGAGRGRRGPGLHLPLGRRALARTPRRSITYVRHSASRGCGGDRQTRSRVSDPASARCDRLRPEDRTAESSRPDRIRPESAWDHEPTQDHRHAPRGRQGLLEPK